MKKIAIAVLCAGILLSCCMSGCNRATDGGSDQTTQTTATEKDTADTLSTDQATDAEETSAEPTETQAEETDTDAEDETTADEETTAEEETLLDTEEETQPAEISWPKKTLFFNNQPQQSITILASQDGNMPYAAAELQKYLEKMGLRVQSDGVFNIRLQLDESLGNDNYRILTGETAEDGLTIIGGNNRGVLYGVYGFLEDFADVHFYTPSLEVCDRGSIQLRSNKTYEHTSTFELRQTDWYTVRNNPDWCVKNGVNFSHWYGEFSEQYGGSWNYGAFVHTLSGLTGTPSDRQPCLTDPENLEKTIAAVRNILQNNPGIDVVSVSQNDNSNYCKCEGCAAIDAEEGSPAGTLLRFVNAVAADIAADYPDVVIDTLAYQYTRKAPSITKPLPNVCIRLCSIECCFTHALSDSTCSENLAFREDLIAWSQICDRIYIWDYTANFLYYLPTHPNFHILRDNMRFFADHNVKGMFPEGNYSSDSGEFGELRTYLLAKLMMDPYMSANEYYELMDDFLEAYYGDGWMYIRAYIDFMCGEGAGAHSSITIAPLDLIPRAKYTAMEDMLTNLWDQAEALAGDRLPYVQRSRLQWRYIQLMLHPDEEEAKRFAADVQAAKLYWNEWHNTELPEDTDFSRPPDRWV